MLTELPLNHQSSAPLISKRLILSVLGHGVVGPGGQMGESLFGVLLNGPTPGFTESRQVHSHSAREGLGVQVHLSFVVIRKVAHLKVASKDLLKGIPAKLFLQLHGRRWRKTGLYFLFY